MMHNSLTIRSEILKAMRILEGNLGTDTFQLKAIREQVLRQNGSINVSSINTHIVSAMCVNAPKNHVITYPDLYRVARGFYKLNN